MKSEGLNFIYFIVSRYELALEDNVYKYSSFMLF